MKSRERIVIRILPEHFAALKAKAAGRPIQVVADEVLAKGLAERPNAPAMLKAWRKAEGLSQTAAAMRFGVSASELCHWERDGKRPSDMRRVTIARVTCGAVPACAWWAT